MTREPCAVSSMLSSVQLRATGCTFAVFRGPASARCTGKGRAGANAPAPPVL